MGKKCRFYVINRDTAPKALKQKNNSTVCAKSHGG